VRRAIGGTKYAVANAAEGEPGTFKDRALLRANPYQLVEGLVIAAFAVGAAGAYVAIKRAFAPEIDRLTRAIEDMQAAGLAGDIAMTVAVGPDEYLFGEEKALLEVIEGKAPLPRVLPPYQHGLFASVQLGWQGAEPGLRPSPTPGQSNPTLVNNVETLSNVPHILARGAEWFRGFGTDASPGILVCTAVGDVARPGVGEVEMGVPLGDAIGAVGGGVREGHRIKAVFLGVASGVIGADQLGTPLTYEDMAAIGSGLGAAGFIVYDETACMVEVARLFSQFLYVESCGQCPPCKLGAGEITERLNRIELGSGSEADLRAIGARLRTVTDANRCALGAEEQALVSSLLRRFPEEFAAHIEAGTCPLPRPLAMPKLLDVAGGVAVYDERYAQKQPDWSYTPAPPATPPAPAGPPPPPAGPPPPPAGPPSP